MSRNPSVSDCSRRRARAYLMYAYLHDGLVDGGLAVCHELEPLTILTAAWRLRASVRCSESGTFGARSRPLRAAAPIFRWVCTNAVRHEGTAGRRGIGSVVRAMTKLTRRP